MNNNALICGSTFDGQSVSQLVPDLPRLSRLTLMHNIGLHCGIEYSKSATHLTLD